MDAFSAQVADVNDSCSFGTAVLDGCSPHNVEDDDEDPTMTTSTLSQNIENITINNIYDEILFHSSSTVQVALFPAPITQRHPTPNAWINETL
jgi:hypothetical protein